MNPDTSVGSLRSHDVVNNNVFDGDVDVYNFGASVPKVESRPSSSRVNKTRQEINSNSEVSAGRANNRLELKNFLLTFPRSSHRRCSVRKCFLNISQCSQENTHVGVSL